MKRLVSIAMALLAGCVTLSAQRLSVGGYGEVALSRNFYSDNVYRYSTAGAYAKDPGHGRFDIPHAVIYLGYDFGKGWTMQTEIEFEHTGTGAAVEKEFEEAGEGETEIEKGGEVELEQFWIQKSFFPELNVRMGHIVVPVGGLNNAHEPLNFFNVYRPEGEYTILPSTWHDTGISIWGQAGPWRYEAQVVAGLDAFLFNRDNFVKNGAGSPYEFKVANNYGLAARIDNTSVKGLRLGLSGYWGNSMHNSYPNDMQTTARREEDGTYTITDNKYKSLKGRTLIGAFDFAYRGHGWIVRGNADYGSLTDAYEISRLKRNGTSNNAPYQKSFVGKGAYAAGLEAGYDLFDRLVPVREQHLYVFARGERYDSFLPADGQTDFPYTGRTVVSAGINWFPIPEIAVKCEYLHRFLSAQYNDEPAVNIGIVYQAFFKK